MLSSAAGPAQQAETSGSMRHWVFLDVGNVLLDEDRLTWFALERYAAAVASVRPEVTIIEVVARFDRALAAGARWPLFEAVRDDLDNDALTAVWNDTALEVRARYHEVCPLIPGAAALVERLSSRFELGLIANQGPECRDALARAGLLDAFRVVAFAETVGIHKPDPRLFSFALDRAGVPARRAWMVGDRLENDVEPALQVGMQAVWLRWPIRAAKGWAGNDDASSAYLSSLERGVARATAGLRRAATGMSVDGSGGAFAVVDEIGQTETALTCATSDSNRFFLSGKRDLD